jgi:microcompartment protein CcmK/EutM
MRLGIVRGHVILAPAVPELRGMTLVVLEPVTMTNLIARSGLGGGKSLVAVDALGAAEGQMVAFTEGREAANPFWPKQIPVDAYCTLIVDSITTGNTEFQQSEV